MMGPGRNYSDRGDEPELQPSSYAAYEPSSQQYYDRDLPSFEDHNTRIPPPAHNNSPPPPPAHRSIPAGMHPDTTYGQAQGQRSYGAPGAAPSYSNFSTPGVTPGMDNLGERAAGGGINGIAIGVANMNERESGTQALQDISGWGRNGDGPAGPRGAPLDRSQPSTAYSDNYNYDQSMPPRPMHTQASYGSNAALAATAMSPGVVPSSNSSSRMSVDSRTPSQSAYMYPDGPYNRHSASMPQVVPAMGEINPNDVADDDDWGMGPQTQPQQHKRRSFIPFGSHNNSSRESTPGAGAGAVAGGAAVGAGVGGAALLTTRDASGYYKPVPGGPLAATSASDLAAEKSEWLETERHSRKKLAWIVSIIIVLVVIGAVVGGVLGAVLKQDHKKTSAGGGQNSSPEEVAADNKDDLSIKSAEIQKLMGNSALHKVFPGMDYTPLNSQYPDCMHAPPSQNNVTRDLAVLSQMTNAVRLYGTDCNQTEMVLHAIDRLELKDMKVWLGVWLGDNSTTNTRQIEQMWNILDNYDTSRFKGVIIGNEVLFREDLTETELLEVIAEVKTNLTSKSIDLPVATSDLGDNWTAEMATKVDIVMSNVHPFFAGVEVEAAAGWTWEFWTTHDVVLTKTTNPDIQQIVAEVGWPSAGGNNCGASDCTSKTQGSVSGVKEMNTFMESWVCESLVNGTEYFWFEAFDEPWKIRFNTPGKEEWEDKWGLMDVNRKLKDGIKIPDCGGRTAK